MCHEHDGRERSIAPRPLVDERAVADDRASRDRVKARVGCDEPRAKALEGVSIGCIVVADRRELQRRTQMRCVPATSSAGTGYSSGVVGSALLATTVRATTTRTIASSDRAARQSAVRTNVARILSSTRIRIRRRGCVVRSSRGQGALDRHHSLLELRSMHSRNSLVLRSSIAALCSRRCQGPPRPRRHRATRDRSSKSS